MKKGLIVEHHRRYTIVLAKNGVFYKAKPMHDKQVGEDVLFEEYSANKRSFIHFRRIAMIPIAALFILLLSPLYLWLANDKVYAVISIDINPSLNVKVDRNYQVVDVKANNKDGQRVLEALDMKGKSLEETTNRILLYVKDAFAIEEDAPVLVAVSYLDEEKESNSVVDVLHQQIEKVGLVGTVYQAAEEWRIQAEEQEVSMNVIAHETLGEISGTSKEEEMIIGDTNQALISQFFNNKHSSSNDEQETNEVSEVETETENVHTDLDEPLEKEPIIEETDGNHPQLPVQASDRAKERVSNTPAATNGKPHETGRNGKSKPSSEHEKKKGSTDQVEPRTKEIPSKQKEPRDSGSTSNETTQNDKEPDEEKLNNEEEKGLDE